MTTTDTALLRAAAAAGRLAPSVHNTQPWWFAVEDGSMTVYADPARRLDVLDPAGRQLVISCGAAIANVDLAIRAVGRLPEIELVPTARLASRLAVVRLGGPHAPSPLETLLADAIPRRATNRHALDGSRVSTDMLHGLDRLVDRPGVRVAVVDDLSAHAGVVSLTTVADRVQAERRTFREELRRWSRADDSSPDGVPYSSRGLGAAGARRLSPPVRDFDVDGRAGYDAHEPDPTVDRPLVVAVWTDADRPLDWLRAGIVTERVLLAVTAAGLAASFVNQPLDDVALRPYVADQVGADGPVQVMLRIGAGLPVHQAPRRPVEDVLL